MTQRVPEDGVYVTYWWDMGNHLNSVHRTPTAALAAIGGMSLSVGFVRWDSDGIEPIQPDPLTSPTDGGDQPESEQP